MKKFTKIMLSVAAVTAVSATMAISAMAEDTVTGTYASETGVVTLEGVVSSGDQQTLLVLTEDAATVTESIIAQIDQDASISQFVLPANLTEGTYYIRIGGTNGTIQKGTLTISSGGGDVQTVKITVGDVNLDGNIAVADAGYILRSVSGYTTRISNVGKERKAPDNSSVFIGDVNLDGNIAVADAGYILRSVSGYTTRISNVGHEIEVLAEE